MIATPVSAAPINPHAYALQRSFGPYYGAYFANSLGQEDLTQNDRSAYEPFINKEVWFIFDSAATQWIEVGDTAGIIAGLNRVGHFYAENYVDSTGTTQYFEALIDPNAPVPTGDHTFTIAAGSGRVWNVYVDGVSKAAISDFPTMINADYEDNGIEASDDQTTFRSGTLSYGLQYQDSLANWYYWGSATQNDTNTFGWTSTFSTLSAQYNTPTTVFSRS